MTRLDVDKIKAAVLAYRQMNKAEQSAFWIAIEVGSESPVPLPVEEPEPLRMRGPDKRGQYKCSKCGKVLPTKRGRNIHKAMHKAVGP